MSFRSSMSATRRRPVCWAQPGLFYTYAVQAVGRRAYVAGGGNLYTVDATNPAAPQVVGSFNTPTWAVGVTVHDERPTWPMATVVVYRPFRSRDRAPLAQGTLVLRTGYATAVAATADLVLLANRDAGLYIARVTQPPTPTPSPTPTLTSTPTLTPTPTPTATPSTWQYYLPFTPSNIKSLSE
ncbi:MAG: hypothetical protein HZY76_21700 [Anaerolineae bacterium]|nr:MAG: hypothetical protein HZY76_21700 [Anaerolineae bacterium]